MMLGRQLAVSLVVLASSGFAAGCTGDGGDSGGGGNNGAVMRATLTGDGCRYEGSTTPGVGTFSVAVRNETNKVANFVLMVLPEDAKLKDVENWFAKAFQSWEQTGKYVLHPITWVSSTLVAPHAASELPANVSTGRLAVLCESGPLWPPSHVVAAAELDVTS
jgi:hypothetical protein